MRFHQTLSDPRDCYSSYTGSWYFSFAPTFSPCSPRSIVSFWCVDRRSWYTLWPCPPTTINVSQFSKLLSESAISRNISSNDTPCSVSSSIHWLNTDRPFGSDRAIKGHTCDYIWRIWDLLWRSKHFDERTPCKTRMSARWNWHQSHCRHRRRTFWFLPLKLLRPSGSKLENECQ